VDRFQEKQDADLAMGVLSLCGLVSACLCLGAQTWLWSAGGGVEGRSGNDGWREATNREATVVRVILSPGDGRFAKPET